MLVKTTLYQQITQITEDYFGPPAARYVSRMSVSHLGKEPENIQPHDIPELSHWIKATVALITDDDEIIAELTRRLEELSA